MKVTIIHIVIGALATVTKGLLKGLEDLEFGGRVETIKTTALLKTAGILWRVLDTWGDLVSPNIKWKTRSQKTKPTNTWASWRLTPSNKQKWKKKSRKNTPEELENYSRQNSIAEILSKE